LNVAPLDRAFAWILQTEGGYVNDPRDPGGETRYGISKRAYPAVEISKLSPDDAKAIYRRDYWDACRCSELPAAVALAVFDAAVNQGVGVAARLLQKALVLAEDGVLGPATMGAARAARPDEIVTRMVVARWDRYQHTANAATYLRGWTHRLFRLQAECLGLQGAA